MLRLRIPFALPLLLCLLVPSLVKANSSVHVTYLWHLEQPIYWPAPNTSGWRYQTVWDSIQVPATAGKTGLPGYRFHSKFGGSMAHDPRRMMVDSPIDCRVFKETSGKHGCAGMNRPRFCPIVSA